MIKLAKRSEVITCHEFGVKTPKPKFLFVATYFQKGYVSGRMINDILEVWTLCCQNTMHLCLYMVVFGISMMDANMQECPNPMLISGKRNSTETENVMSIIRNNWKKGDGK